MRGGYIAYVDITVRFEDGCCQETRLGPVMANEPLARVGFFDGVIEKAKWMHEQKHKDGSGGGGV